MTSERQLGQIHLKWNRLIIERFGKDGQPSGKRKTWTIKTKSNLPREMFFKIVGFLQHGIKRYGTDSMDDMTMAAQKALGQVGEAFGCEIGDRKKQADLYWLLDGRRFIAWQIHEARVDERRVRKLTRSKAPLRVVVVIKRGGFFEIKPQSTRQE
jgi:hypothetical protein